MKRTKYMVLTEIEFKSGKLEGINADLFNTKREAVIYQRNLNSWLYDHCNQLADLDIDIRLEDYTYNIYKVEKVD